VGSTTQQGSPLIELFGHLVEKLASDGELVLYRGWQPGKSDSALITTALAAEPSAEATKRLEHEYALAGELESAWAVRPLALLRDGGRVALLCEDPGGEPFDRMLGRPLGIRHVLEVGIGLAAALVQVHRHAIIHKDIKPANMLVAGDGKVRLAGFGIASRQPRERQPPVVPQFITGTLAYMAPEQTGRMNRSVDARSDLYSAGVSMYQALTGALPFQAADPMEWVHCHIARQPIPPDERVEGVPHAIAAIVMKLLAKIAEERYQTAAGLEGDLRRCLIEWDAAGAIRPFALGARDASDQLLIPEKLYGREVEIRSLVGAFDEVVRNGTTGLVLVSGYSGIGKSSVVNELHKALVPLRGNFASGKFDQYKRNIPYATLAQAFQGLIRSLLSGSEAERGRWRDAFGGALGPNAQLMVNLVPDLELIIGKQPPVPELPPQDAQNRFYLTFRRFLGVFARPEHPLALFLDDLQWLDPATLDLLERLVTDPEVRCLLVIGAYRDNEVDPSHPLARTLTTMRKDGARVHEVVLAPLTVPDVAHLVADALRANWERVQGLAQLVHQKTGGNPFFVIQFLTTLAEEGLLAFDRGASTWQWNVEAMVAMAFTENVVQLMSQKLTRVPETTREVLGELACLGIAADVGMLAAIRDTDAPTIHATLWEAVRSGLVSRLGDEYAFVHDRVQEPAYALIPPGDRSMKHLRIGRVLAARTSPVDAGEKIFDIVSQFDRSVGLIHSPEECQQVAEFRLVAGRRAKMSTAYSSALAYFAGARALLPEDSWERRYQLAFEIEFNMAECEFLTGEIQAAEARLSVLSGRARNLVDSAVVACLRVTLYTTSDHDRAIAVCLEFLRHVGVHWSPHPTAEDVQLEYESTLNRLGGRPVDEIINLPAMTDPVCKAVLEVLTAVQAAARFTDQNLPRLIAARMANISLEHGHTDGSCMAYMWFGQLLIARFNDYQSGLRFGKLGLDLAERRGLDRFGARLYHVFGHSISPWVNSTEVSLGWLRRAFDAAQKAGDLTYAAYARNSSVTIRFVRGDGLAEVQQEAEAALGFVEQAQFKFVAYALGGILRVVRMLRGLSPEFGVFSGAPFVDAAFETHLTADRRFAWRTCLHWIRTLQAQFFAGNYAAAVRAAEAADELLYTQQSLLGAAECRFYGALARAGDIDTVGVDERRRRLNRLGADLTHLETCAENCPETFESQMALLAGEIARAEERDGDAMRWYERAIAAAQQHGSIQVEALANELAARFYGLRGFATIAQAYLRNARHCYSRWGALGKVRQLELSYPLLGDGRSGTTSAAVIGTPVERLDLIAVVRASQALSGEIVLEKLIETLMRIAVQHAGAQRGTLILIRGARPQVVAEALVAGGRIDIAQRQAAVTSSTLPESIVQEVFRNRTAVILEDASTSAVYAQDPYVSQRRPRSVLALPILERGALIAVLYLENNLAPGAFTAERLAVLELLASQVAISLQNAALYEDLRRENADRKRAEDEQRRIEAYLAAGQSIVRTGSWAWNVDTNDVYWSQEVFSILGLDPTSFKPRAGASAASLPAGDQQEYWRKLQSAVRDRSEFAHEYLVSLPDGSTKYVQSVAKPFVNSFGFLEYIGVLVDITDRRRAEGALRNAHEMQMQLAHANRVATIGHLTASITHEVTQPLAATLANAQAALLWLDRRPPDLEEARQALGDIVRGTNRAVDVIGRIRDLFKKAPQRNDSVDMNEAIREVIELTRSEAMKNAVSVHTELTDGVSPIEGDRVQLQQVVLNLIVNAIQAMSAVADGARNLLITTSPAEPHGVVVAVKDSGPGLAPDSLERIFNPFYSTKPDGMGMGLAICRSIVEAHGGRLRVEANEPRGAVFRFTLPMAKQKC
jgi:predicted ATPase/C4-dicarboxylate-specific signal transduction histidine kinase